MTSCLRKLRQISNVKILNPVHLGLQLKGTESGSRNKLKALLTELK